MANKCKRKGCNNEALNKGRYCNYHQSKREETKKRVVDGALVLASFAIAIVYKKGKK